MKKFYCFNKKRTYEKSSLSEPKELLSPIPKHQPLVDSHVGNIFHIACELDSPQANAFLDSIFLYVMSLNEPSESVMAILDAALSLDVSKDREKLHFMENATLIAGSGKKGLKLPNVSTPAALIAAAAGRDIVKIGSAAASSSLGSLDLASANQIESDKSVESIATNLKDSRFSFVSVEEQSPCFDHIYGRKFNYINPISFGFAILCAPVVGVRVIYGLSDPRTDVCAKALARRGVLNADVICSEIRNGCYVDELIPGKKVFCSKVVNGVVQPREVFFCKEPQLESFPEPVSLRDVRQSLEQVLIGGAPSDYQKIVISNAAFIYSSQLSGEAYREALALVENVINTGAALSLLYKLRSRKMIRG